MYPPNWRAPVLSAVANASGWVTCPGCQARFRPSDPDKWTGRRHRPCGQRIALAGQTSDLSPVWCVVGNVTDERPYGPGGQEWRRGTIHFAPGAKVYCFPPLWGDGYEKIQVIGRHRGSHRYVTMVIRSDWVRNWRTELVYSPTLIDLLSQSWDGTEDARQRAELIANEMNTRNP